MFKTKLVLLAALLASAGGALAQVDLARGGPIDTLAPNPKPLTYVSQSLTRNASATYRYFDDLYQLSSGLKTNLELVADPSGSARKVFKHKVLKTDPLYAGGSRTEVTLKYEYVIEGVRWYAVSVLFPADWQFNVEPTVIAQLHTSQKSLTVPPPLALVVNNKDLNLEAHYNYRSTVAGATDPATRANSGEQLVRLGKIVTNKWYCFVLRADWSHKPGIGSVKVWMNGNLAYETKNAYNAYQTWLGNYPKVGLYLPGVMAVPSRTLYSDFIHVGGAASTYETMAALTPCGVTAAATAQVIR